MGQKQDFHWSTPLGLGASFALLFAGIGIVLDLQGAPDAYERFGYMVSSLAAAAAYLSLGFGVALAIGFAAGLVFKGGAAAVSVAAATALGVYTAAMPLVGAYQLPLPSVGGESTWALAILAFLLAAAMLAVLLRFGKEAVWSKSLGFCLTLALLVLATSLSLWQMRFDGPVWPWIVALALAVVAVVSWKLPIGRQSLLACGVLGAVLAGGFANWQAERGYSPSAQLGGAPGEIPRVILITVDTLRADSFFGDPATRPATPAVDAFAKESYVFKNAISSGPWTPPGMSSLLTGLDPFAHRVGIDAGVLPTEIPTLPERMAEAGYQIAAVGLNPIVRWTGLIARWPWAHFHPYRPTPRSIGNYLLTGGLGYYEWNPSTAELADWSIEWLRQNHNRDFYFWLHVYDPHIPYAPPDEFVDRSLQTERIGPQLTTSAAEGVRIGSPAVGADDRVWMRRLYDAEVTYVDSNLGRIFDTLRELGIYDDSLIVITSDHGEEFYEHEGFEHGNSLYNELLHVPLLIRPPGGARGRVIADYVPTASVTPTILELAGVEFDPAEMGYPSLAPQLADPTVVQETPIFSAGVRFHENWLSVLLEGHKYIRRVVSGTEELYDLRADPSEMSSLDDPELMNRARQLLEERIKHGDAMRKRYGVSGAEATGLEDSTRRQLESLGYIQ